MDTKESSASPAHPLTDERDDTVEAHYASLERGIPCGCYGGYHYIGHMLEDPESGEEVEVYAVVPCHRCSGNSR